MYRDDPAALKRITDLERENAELKAQLRKRSTWQRVKAWWSDCVTALTLRMKLFPRVPTPRKLPSVVWRLPYLGVDVAVVRPLVVTFEQDGLLRVDCSCGRTFTTELEQIKAVAPSPLIVACACGQRLELQDGDCCPQPPPSEVEE